ncbi:MAG: phage minor head protein [Tagaea sp.]|nr:phage minor head protein [Tagaea sp.]
MTASPIALPFDEAIAFFRQKLGVKTKTWRDLWQGMHARAFTIAGALDDSLLSDFQSAIDKAIASGTTIGAFRKDFDKIVAAHGWDYNGGRNWRSRVIFDTNVRMAHQAGKWEAAQRVKERRPYLRYQAVKDDRTRPEHMAWHGLVLPIDDPFWKTHYPPNGWNCRCTVQTLSDRDLARYGYEVGESPKIEMETRSVKTEGGIVNVAVPKGIDTGFGYNVGEAAGEGFTRERLALERAGAFEEIVSPVAPPQSRPPLPADRAQATLGPRVKPGDEAGLLDAWRKAIGGDDAIFEDPTGQRVQVTRAIVDHTLADPKRVASHRERYWPFIRETIEDPAEIWTTFARSKETGAVRLRRRYVKRIEFEKDRWIAIVADRDDGVWSGLTIFDRDRDIAAVRKGHRVYARAPKARLS